MFKWKIGCKNTQLYVTCLIEQSRKIRLKRKWISPVFIQNSSWDDHWNKAKDFRLNACFKKTKTNEQKWLREYKLLLTILLQWHAFNRSMQKHHCCLGWLKLPNTQETEFSYIWFVRPKLPFTKAIKSAQKNIYWKTEAHVHNNLSLWCIKKRVQNQL